MKKINLMIFLFLITISFSLNKEKQVEFQTQEQATKYSSKTLKEYLKIPQSHIFFSVFSETLWEVVIYQQQCIKKTGGQLKMHITNDDACMEFQMILNTKIPIRKTKDQFYLGITARDLFQIKSSLNYTFPQ